MPTQKTEKRREAPILLGFFLLYICLLSPSLPYVNWASQEAFVLPEVLTPVLGPSFVLFSPAFPFFVFQPLPFCTPFSYSNYLIFLTYTTVCI